MTPPLDIPLDIIGEQPLLKIYTQITFCFGNLDAVPPSNIVAALTSGLEHLSANFPWIAGQVVEESDAHGTTTSKIKEVDRIPRLIVRDLKNDASLAMEALRKNRFPMGILDESIVAPIPTITALSPTPLPNYPVFTLQATFISSGVLLTFLAHHQVMDGIGQAAMISLFSKACNGLPFTASEISSGNLPRDTIVPLLEKSWEPGPELDHNIIRAPYAFGPTATTPAPPSRWINIAFSSASLAKIKYLAMQSLPESTPYISTDDALTAFLHTRIALARSARLAPSTNITLARAVDVRTALNVPKTYPGMLQIMTYHTFTLSKLLSAPLGHIAADLRNALEKENLAHRTRALATFMHRHPEKRRDMSFTATMDLSHDLMLSSWAGQDSYHLDFGMGLGKPEAVRRPKFNEFESLGYLLPRDREGGVVVAVCLREGDLEGLRGDGEMVRFAEFVG